MPEETADGLLTGEQIAALWTEVDQLRDKRDAICRRLGELDDLLLADLRARTGFPRERAGQWPCGELGGQR